MSKVDVLNRMKTGFTLIELLVVITIVSVLIAVLLPALSQSRDLAKQTACMAQLKQITLGGIAYAQANKQNFPPNANNGANSFGVADKPFNQWATGDGVGFYLLSADYVSYNGFFCPSNMVPNFANKNGLGAPAPGVQSARGGYMWRFVRVNASSPHSFVATEGATTGMARLDVGQVFPGVSTLAPSSTAYAADQMLGYRSNTGELGTIKDVHKTGANAGYFDGHGQYRKVDILAPYLGTTLMNADDRVYHRGFLNMLDTQ